MRFRSAALALALLAGGLAVAPLAHAAPPANDALEDATPLTVGVEAPYSLIESTDTDETVCGEGAAVWFTFVAPAAGDYLLYTADSTADADAFIYGTGDDPTACTGEADEPVDSYEMYSLVALGSGESLTIRLVRAEPNTPANGQIGVVAISGAEDDFGDAQTVPAPAAGATSAIGRTVPAAFGLQGPESTDCGPGTMETSSAWFEFTAPTAGTWFFEATSDENLDTAIYRGSSLATLDLIGCTLWSEGTSAGQSVHLDDGETVHVRIGASATATFSLRVRSAPVRMTAEKLTDVADTVESAELVVVDGQPVVLYSDGPDDDLRIIERQDDGTWVDSLVTDGTAFGGPDIDDFVSALVVGDELMVVFVTDTTANLLMFGVRDADGDWTFETIDTVDEFQYPDLALVDGVPAVSYYDSDGNELRFAERNGDGTWDVVVVDDDGPGTSSDVGYQNVLFDIDGEPAIAYLDYSAGAIRWASRSGGTWSESLVYTHAPTTYGGFDGVIDGDGNPLLIAQFEYSSFLVLRLVEGVWTTEWPEHQPESTQVAYAEYSPLQLELTPDGRPIFVWYSYGTANYWYAVTEQLSDGTWRTDDAFAASQLLAEGLVDIEIDPYILGATMLPDGRFAFAGDLTDDIWYFEEALVIAVGDDVDTDAAVDFALDGAGTADGFGALEEIVWTLPAGCFAAEAAVVTTGRCAGPADGEVTLTVTDTDGYTRSASFDLTAGRAVCDDSPDPFTDVSPTSYALLDITCIYNLGVTTGTSATTYTPAAFVTREMMASFIMRLYRSLTGLTPPTVALPFTDVPATSFAVDDIAQLFGLGITTGTSATTYSPYDQVTREQMVTFLGRLYELVRGAPAPVVETPFTDTDDLTWSAEFVASMYGIGVTTGTTSTTFSPYDNVTREQVAALLARLYRAE